MPSRSIGASRRSAQPPRASSASATMRRSSRSRSARRGRGSRPRPRRRGGAAPAWRVRRSRVDCRSQSRSMPAVSRSSAPSIAATPAQRERGVDPLVKLAMAAVGHGQHRRALGGGEAASCGAAGDRAVGDQEHAVVGVDRFGRLLGAAHELDRNAVAAQALDRGGQRGRHALDEDDDRRRAGGGGEPRPGARSRCGRRAAGSRANGPARPIRDRPRSAPQAPHFSLPLKRRTVSAPARG